MGAGKRPPKYAAAKNTILLPIHWSVNAVLPLLHNDLVTTNHRVIAAATCQPKTITGSHIWVQDDLKPLNVGLLLQMFDELKLLYCR